MYWQRIILTVLCLGIRYAADAQLLQEQTSPVTGVRDGIYKSPSLKVYQRQNTWSQLSASFRRYQQDLYLQQEGNGRQTSGVHSETYLKPDAKTTLWGQAYYSNEDVYKVNFNESSNYGLVYPYVMADTAGGDLKAETYSFSGGLAKAVGAYQLGLAAGFRGQQSYRARDPRQENISSLIDLGLSASRRLGRRYVLALDLDGTKYSQRNRLEFVSELGAPLVYHDAGLGVYNEFLAGSRTSANFNGVAYGASLRLSPFEYKGWFAHAAIRQLDLGKLLGGIVFEVAEVKERNLNGSIGYLYQQEAQHFIAKLDAASVNRKGIEAKFNNRDSQVDIKKISEDIRYVHDYMTFRFRTVYGRTGGAIHWFGGLTAEYNDHLHRYVQPDRQLAYTGLLAGIDLTARKQLGKAMLTVTGEVRRKENLESSGLWNDIDRRKAIYTMLNSNFAYLTASGMYYDGEVRVDFPLTAKLSCFIKAEAASHSGIGKRDFRIMTAFQF